MKKTKPTEHQFRVRFIGGPADGMTMVGWNPWPLKFPWWDKKEKRSWLYHLRIGGPGDEFDVPRYVLA